jgi:hypothetical protein
VSRRGLRLLLLEEADWAVAYGRLEFENAHLIPMRSAEEERLFWVYRLILTPRGIAGATIYFAMALHLYSSQQSDQ